MTDKPNRLDILPELRSLLARQPHGSADRVTLNRAIAEVVALRENLTATQTRGTELLEETRRLRTEIATLTRGGAADVDPQ